jgi:hypothetical protein
MEFAADAATFLTGGPSLLVNADWQKFQFTVNQDKARESSEPECGGNRSH